MPVRAILLGGAATVWEDVIALEEEFGPWAGLVGAVNDVGVHWPRRLDHWGTLHVGKMPRWEKQRQAYGFPQGYMTWGPRVRYVERRVQPWPGGSSGLLMLQVLLGPVGAEKVVLCGMPMERDFHFAESSERHILDGEGQWAHADKHWRAWKREGHRLQGRVKSMGGRTADLLGRPDRDWLEG